MIKRIYNTIIENYTDSEFLQAFSDEVESYDQEFAEALRNLDIQRLLDLVYEQELCHPFVENSLINGISYSTIDIRMGRDCFLYEKILKKWFHGTKGDVREIYFNFREIHFEDVPETVLKLVAIRRCFHHWYKNLFTIVEDKHE